MKKTFYIDQIPKRGSKYDMNLVYMVTLISFAIALGIAWVIIFQVMPWIAS